MTAGRWVLVGFVRVLSALCLVWVTVGIGAAGMPLIAVPVSLAEPGGPHVAAVVICLLVILVLVYAGFLGTRACHRWLSRLRWPDAPPPEFPVLPPPASR